MLKRSIKENENNHKLNMINQCYSDVNKEINDDIAKAKAEIIEKNRIVTDYLEKEVSKYRNVNSNLIEDYRKYSSFEEKDIIPIMLELLNNTSKFSIIKDREREGIIHYYFYSDFSEFKNFAFKNGLTNIATFGYGIEFINEESEPISFYNFYQNKNGFIEHDSNIKFGYFTNLENFIDMVINYRIDNDLKTITKSELDFLLNEFIIKHPNDQDDIKKLSFSLK